MKSVLENDFSAVAGIKNPQRRGIAFQRFLRILLTQSGFEVKENPKVARPRQSDLFGSRDNLDYLIEAKWLSRKIGSSDIDDLRSRLNRTPADVIGCIVSMSEYASTAVRAVEENRQRELLLFGPKEIQEIVHSGRGLSELIRFKRRTLRIDGRVWFLSEKNSWQARQQFQFLKCDRSLMLNGSAVTYIEDRTAWIPVIFTTLIPEFQAGGDGVMLQINPQITSHTDLKNYVALLHGELGLSDDGAFVITQTKCNWRGFGLQNSMMQAERWLERYHEAGLKEIHHSEDLHYFDKCHSGFIMFTIRQTVGENINVPYHSCSLTAWLPGIPLDTTPFKKICANAREPFPFFQQVNHKVVERVEFREGIVLEEIGQITLKYSNENLVCGLIAKNPFFGNKAALPQGAEKYSMFHSLRESQHLICDMSDWHNLESIADQYRLTRMEGVQIGSATVVRPVCTWNNIINRKYEFDGDPKPLPTALGKSRSMRIKNIRLMPQREVPKLVKKK